MAMVEAEERFGGAEEPGDRRRRAEERCLEAEQRCFRAERRRFEAERQREQVEQLLAQSRSAGLRMEQIVAELRRLVGELRDAAAPAPPESDPDQMVDALSAAIVRLRANVQAVGVPAQPTRGPVTPSPAATPAPAAARLPHKHSLSWIGRWRMRRKQRQSR